LSATETLLHRAGELLMQRDEAGGERAALDDAKRTATFVVATERPVRMWHGVEVLRVSGADLKRFRKNPVVLDTHNAWSIKSILGTAKVRVEERQLLADITFDTTPEGEAAWQRVKSGSLRATSIGYAVDRSKTKQLAEGETDGSGDSLVTGPAWVSKKWGLFEITLCPVPADEDAVRRSFYSGGASRGSKTMKYPTSENDDGAEDGAEKRTPQPAPKSKEELDAERDARIAKLRAEQRAAIDTQIRGMAPAALKDVAEQCVLDGLSVEEARTALKKAQAERNKPVGTPEPAPTAPTTQPAPKAGDEIRSLVAKATGQGS
jgi:HK97 family phage prohead protease